MKKAFTLIELLAVIIILAIVALIATPIILDVIDEASESANLSQAYLLVDGIEQLYANSFLDNTINLPYSDGENVYDMIDTTGEKPPSGTAYVLGDGRTYLKVTIGDECYLKEYDTSEIVKCNGEDLEGESDIVKQDISNLNEVDVFTTDGDWFTSDDKIEISALGNEYKYCISDSVCVPDIEGDGKEVVLGSNPITYVCVDVFDNGSKVHSQCENYFIDDVVPTINPLTTDVSTILATQSFLAEDYFEYSYGGSDGVINCSVNGTNIKETSGLATSNTPYELKCTVTSNSGLSATATKQIKVDPVVYTPTSCFTVATFTNTTTNIVEASVSSYKYGTSGCGADVIIPPTVKIGEVDYPVTVIGSTTFYNDAVVSVSIPNSITAIGYSAFYQTKLKSIVIPDSVISLAHASFRGSTVEYAKLSNNLELIDYDMFYLSKLKYIVIPSSVKTIGKTAFSTAQLETVIFEEGLETIGENAFDANKIEKLKLPESLKTIGNYAFRNNSLKILDIGNSVSTIATGAFQYNLISEVIFPDSVTSISTLAFNDNNLHSVIIKGEDVDLYTQTFGNNAINYLEIAGTDLVVDKDFIFAGPLTTVVIGNKSSVINGSAFDGFKIENLIINDTVKTIGETAFHNNSISKLILSNSIENIGANAFSDSSIKYVQLPDSLTSIGYRAFYDNPVETFIIGKGLTALPGQLLTSAASLKELIVPPNIESIEATSLDGVVVDLVVYDGRESALGGVAAKRVLCNDLKPCVAATP